MSSEFKLSRSVREKEDDFTPRESGEALREHMSSTQQHLKSTKSEKTWCFSRI